MMADHAFASMGIAKFPPISNPCVYDVDHRPVEKFSAPCQSTEQVLLRMSNPFGYAPADSEVGSKYGNTSGTHMETIYPVTEMLHGEARDLRWAPTAVVR